MGEGATLKTLKVGVLTYYFVIFLAENCIKMKEFEPQGRPWHPLGSANEHFKVDL